MERKQEIQKKTDNQVEKICKLPLTDVILSGKKQDINLALRDFKTTGGVIKYESVLSIPTETRIPELARKDYKNTSMVITAAIHLAMEGMNLIRGMTVDQEIDLAEAIIDTASEDNLAIEDIMLFLQKLVRGEYGSNYESMDIPKFMDKFESYRQDRYTNLLRIREERHLQHKKQGDTGKSNQLDELGQHFSGMAEKLSVMNSELKHLRKENNNLKKNIP